MFYQAQIPDKPAGPNQAASQPQQETKGSLPGGKRLGYPLLSLLFFLLCICGSATSSEAKKTASTAQSSNVFPLYNAIVTNVRFWEKIYSTYSNDLLLVHDANDLQKIYAAVSLLPPDTPQAREKNARIEKQIKEKYQHILEKLASAPPRTSTEKRVAALFPGSGKAEKMRQAARQIRTQNGQRQRFQQSVIRSGAYIKEFKKIFRDAHLPEDLAYLPHVESSFHPGAYSRAGAAGIWQFTRSTGKRYLIIDDAVDQRLDPIAATHAAAKYFRRSYSHLKHWPLAVTSYNYGLPGTIRAQEEFGSYTDVFRSHRTKTFKFAARNFYSEFLAAKKTAKKLEKTLKLNKPDKTCSLSLTGYLRLKDVLWYFRVSQKELKRLNPALLPPVFDGTRRITKQYTLHLPATAAIKQKIATFPKKFYYTTQQYTRLHRVRKGESVSSIAAHFGISATALQKANNLNKEGRIKINQRLRIPTDTLSPGRQKVSLRKNRQKRIQQQKVPLLKAARKKIIKKDF